MYNPTQMVDVLKELHKSDPLGTKIGTAFASNTLLSSGENLSPTVQTAPLDKPKKK